MDCITPGFPVSHYLLEFARKIEKSEMMIKNLPSVSDMKRVLLPRSSQNDISAQTIHVSNGHLDNP